MTHNTGIRFELLTQKIFETLINQDSVRNIVVKHDVTLQGMTAKHQIDVYWEFEIGAVNYATVIQVKDWNAPLNQGELFTFKCVLNDLPGQPKGIVVTRSGYQSGAEEFAKAHGILLFDLTDQSIPISPPIVVTEGSFAKFEITIAEMVMDTIVFDPAFSDSRFEYDSDWLSQQKDIHGDMIISEAKNLHCFDIPRNLILYDEALNLVGSVQDIYTSFIRGMEKTGVMSQQMTKTFDAATFICTSSHILPYIKLKSISSTVTLTAREPIKSPIRLTNIVKVILKNLSDGTERTYEIDKSTRKIE